MRSHESAHCQPASLEVLWLLKSPITMCGKSLDRVLGVQTGHLVACTTTPAITIITVLRSVEACGYVCFLEAH